MRGRDEAGTVVVGGGIAGTALAYYLARAGMEDVLVVDRDQLGSGSTAASFSGVRQQFSTPFEIELSKRGLRFWKTCEEQFGSPCPFHQTGYLFVSTRQEVMRRFEAAADLQRELGAGPVEILEPRAVRDVAPWLAVEDLAGGSYTPEDGRVTGTDGVTALAKGARELGVEIRQYWPVSSIERSGASGYRVRGPKGDVAARQVVVAAGIWTPALLGPLGFSVDVRPLVLHYAITSTFRSDATVPLTVDFDTGFCIEREGTGLAVSVLQSELPPGYGPQEMIEEWFGLASKRAPELVELGISHLLSAEADEVSDGHPNAGQLDDGLWVLAGFAGHGVMHGPVLAELLARVIVGDPDPHLDLSVCDPLRVVSPERGSEWMIPHRQE